MGHIGVQKGLNMNAVIVYYSLTGNTEFVADLIAKRLGADLLRIEPVKQYPDSGAKKYIWGGRSAVMGDKPKLRPYVFDGDHYDVVIFGSPVWARNPAPPIKSFINDNLGTLKDKRVAAFLCYAGGGADKALAKREKLLDKKLDSTLVMVEPRDTPNMNLPSEIDKFLKSV